MNKLYRLQVMQQQWSACTQCQFLCQDRKNVVFGYGQYEKFPIKNVLTGEVIGLGAQVLIVGEAPGINEDEQGLPFVGKSGALLDQYLASTSARPEVLDKLREFNESSGDTALRHGYNLRQLLTQEFFFTNVVACHPPENRDPTPKEIAACKPRLMEIIYTVDPVVIIAVGNIAIQTLLGRKVSITQIRGEMFDIEFPGKLTGGFRYPVVATLHPSYLMRRNDFNQRGGDGEKTYRDFLKVMKMVDEFNWRHYGIPRPALRPKDDE